MSNSKEGRRVVVSRVPRLDLSKEQDRKVALDDYREVGTNWRYWGEVRFKQLTVFLSVTAVLGGGTITEKVGENQFLRLMLGALGFTITIVFLLLEERATFYRRTFMDHARHLEATIGLTSQYRFTKNTSKEDSAKLYRFFFALIGAAWIGWEAHLSELPLMLILFLFFAFLAGIYFQIKDYGEKNMKKHRLLYRRLRRRRQREMRPQ